MCGQATGFVSKNRLLLSGRLLCLKHKVQSMRQVLDACLPSAHSTTRRCRKLDHNAQTQGCACISEREAVDVESSKALSNSFDDVQGSTPLHASRQSRSGHRRQSCTGCQEAGCQDWMLKHCCHLAAAAGPADLMKRNQQGCATRLQLGPSLYSSRHDTGGYLSTPASQAAWHMHRRRNDTAACSQAGSRCRTQAPRPQP